MTILTGYLIGYRHEAVETVAVTRLLRRLSDDSHAKTWSKTKGKKNVVGTTRPAVVAENR